MVCCIQASSAHRLYTKAPLPEGFHRRFRDTFKGTIIAAGGFTRDIAEQALEVDELDLVAFGVPYIANPDLVERMQNGWPLAESDRTTYYGVSGSSEKGYTDYYHFIGRMLFVKRVFWSK